MVLYFLGYCIATLQNSTVDKMSQEQTGREPIT